MKHRVELRNHPLDLYHFRIRLAISTGFVFFLFTLLFARSFYLQVSKGDHYHTLAEANRISIQPLVPNRGLIYDRNGKVLAQNFSAYTLEIVPSQVSDLDATLNELASIVAISPNDRQRFSKLLKESKRFKSLPIRTRLSDKEVARFAANRYRFPGVEINAGLLREYPYGDIASHVIGYINRINDKDLEHLEENKELDNYRGSHHIGKIGIEQSYEKHLHGITGFEEVETDVAGRSVRVIAHTPPIPGNDLILSLDINLQEVAVNAFGERRGALVAMDPATGEILAFVSKPGFDANLFVGGIDHDNWNLLNNSIDRPLNNRALRGLYPPGSTFKPFMALAALELNLRTPEYTLSDAGFFSLPGSNRRFRDWKVGGHGMVNLHKSLVVSCDTYYYSLANDMGINNIHRFVGQFGLGKKTGIDIYGEVGGLLPSPEWKIRRHKQKWYTGDTISVGIGQGYNLSTPLQLAFATTIIANKGQAYRPHFVRQIQNNELGILEKIDVHPLYTLDIKPENMAIVRDALEAVTHPGGTAARAAEDAEYTFAGKTGTSQVINIKQGERYVEKDVQERYRDHALFVAYAPADEPKIVLSILVENGGHGGAVAAPIARQVMDYFLLGKPLESSKIPITENFVTDDHDHSHDHL